MFAAMLARKSTAACSFSFARSIRFVSSLGNPSPSVNAVTLIGTASAPPQTKDWKDGNSCLGIQVKTVSSFTNPAGETVSSQTFHRVSCYKHKLLNDLTSLKKGDEIYVSGRLQSHPPEFEGKSKIGNTASVVAENVLILTKADGKNV